MNLNILNNRHLYLLRVVLLIGFLFAQENLISWEVGDPTLNRKFIETYLNKIIANDKFDDNSIQASDVIMLQMENTEKGLVLKRLRAKNYDSGEFRRFMMDQVKLMDPKLMDELIKRKYKWGEVSKRELSELESYSTVDNILQERSFKRARDAFWWSTSQLEIATTGSAFIRGRSSSQAFRMEMGLQDLGLHRQIFKNLLLGISNDISSAYVLIPSGSRSVSSVGGKTVPDGHALSGTYGVGFKFDTHSIGGQVNYMDASNTFKNKGMLEKQAAHIVLPTASGLIYWSNTFGLNRNIPTSMGKEMSTRKTEIRKAKKEADKKRIWKTKNNESYEGSLISTENNKIAIIVERNDKAHKQAEKGRLWTTKDDKSIRASVVTVNKKEVTLLRQSDDKRITTKISNLSEYDQEFIESLIWDGETEKIIDFDDLSSEDKRLIRLIKQEISETKNSKGMKVSKPFASLRLKVGLSLVEFIHGSIDHNQNASDKQNLDISDRINNVDALGVFIKAEVVTDNKKSKGYFQINTSVPGLTSLALGIEHNVWGMFNIGSNFVYIPKSSGIEFQARQSSKSKAWTWYPATEDGAFLPELYFSIHF
tara:strand:- start:122 stop:1903 length:1782 start_codon:yes stop_codon:yes gene_type:complete